MKKTQPAGKENLATKKGYNEINPGQPEGAFSPASHNQKPKKDELKSNAADKKAKEDEQ
ncbi:MAG: hypothetical protein ABIR15_22895 [Chitinophagaceae bacterium]